MARNAATVGGATLASRVLGFARDVVVAFALGAGAGADAFFVAFRLPNLLRRLFAEGSLTMAFIPVFTRLREKSGDKAAFALARSVQFWLLLILGGLTIAAVLLAEPLTALIAPGFVDDPARFGLTADLIRICFPYIILISAVGLCMGVLNSLDHFLMPALAPCALNVALIGSALSAWALGLSVPQALAWGVLLGGGAQWLMQQRALAARGFSWRGEWNPRAEGTGRVARLMGPTVFGAAVYQVNILLITLLASFLPEGSVSWLYYADRLVQFPLGVFGIAIATAALPGLSQLAARAEWERFGSTTDTALRLILLISLPSAAGLIGLAEPLVSLLFGRGAFTPADAQATASALIAYSAGLPAIALVRPLVSAFYALEDTRTPVLVAAVCMVLNVGLGWLLMGPMAHTGLALAVTVAGWANAGMLAWAYRVRIGGWPRAARSALICGLLSLGVGLGAWWSRELGGLVALMLIPAWAAAYLGAVRLAGLPEAKLLFDALRRRRGRA
ncbi:murein biosynthesis integral membrane protein MurJ [Desulfohalovibrio reitneri]|uniref:murein biosynthesis integral membrane protein MurJ n=1 Tax=Desulfohalovibrio reitneri TaxID=1307759 RepID=UPI001F005465|nr:murein biosynthesis integral membrane protein MurJ [Desulfohalovibrio reitneri]